MKKLLILSFLISMFACQQTVPTIKTATLFSGEITNPNGNEILLRRGDFEVEIPMEKGIFSMELIDLAEGNYLFYDGSERANLYIIPGKELHLTLDTEAFDETLTLSGPEAAASNYLVKKTLEEEKDNFGGKELYSQDEASFQESLNKKQDQRLAFLNTFEGLPASFLEMEKKAIQYDHLLNLKEYAGAHAYYTNQDEKPSSAAFLKPLEGISMDNEADFLDISSYADLVQSSLMEETVTATLGNLKPIKSAAINSSIVKMLKYNISPGSETLEQDYNALHAAAKDEEFKKEITEKFELCKTLAKGNVSPQFNFEDRNGKMLKLEDLKGKNVYIDVWATWCGPCKREIPDLKKLETAYHGKNVEFVSISIDKMKDKEKWLKMVEEKELGGKQLFSDKDWRSDFVTGYGINGIPRFILVDDEGKIVSADAPRPSSGEEVRKMFDELKI